MCEISKISKICTKCELKKVMEEFPKDKSKFDKHHSTCKQCKREAEAARRSQPGFLEKRRQYDHSERGSIIKKKSDEKYRSSDKYKETITKYYQSDKYKDRIKEYRQQDSYKEYQREWFCSEQGKKSRKKWESSERGKLKRKEWQHSDKSKEYKKWYSSTEFGKLARKKAADKYFENNPELKGFYESKRRALKLQATPVWFNQEEDKVKFMYKVAKELTNKIGKEYHVDHIVPLKSDFVCGLHTVANLQILLGSLNCRKSNRYWPDMP